MNLFSALRERIGAVIAAVFAAIMFCICGVVMTFVLAPQQALKARRVANMPIMDAANVNETAAGEDVLVTGNLADNPIVGQGQYVAYKLERWEVDEPDPGTPASEARGSWATVERSMPDLQLDVNGQALSILATNSVNMNGNLHEELIRAEGGMTASYEGSLLAEGSERYQGFYNGDLTTVFGQKAASGGVIPEDLFAGDRVAFEEHEKQSAQALFFIGICFMIFSPIVLVGGILAALFGRRRRRGAFG